MDISTPTVSPSRPRVLDDTRMRKMAMHTQDGYIRAVRKPAAHVRVPCTRYPAADVRVQTLRPRDRILQTFTRGQTIRAPPLERARRTSCSLNAR
jgi:hypothetical protein